MKVEHTTSTSICVRTGDPRGLEVPAPDLLLGRLGATSRPAAASACRVLSAALGYVNPTDVPWAHLNSSAVTALCATVREGRTPGYARRLLSVLAGLLKCEWRAGRLSGEDLSRLLDSISRPPGVDLPPGRALSDDEVRQILVKCNLKEECMVALGVGGGLRRHEMANLTREDVLGAVPEIMLSVRGKGGKMRLIPIHGSMARIIRTQDYVRMGFYTTSPLLGIGVEGLAKMASRLSTRAEVQFTLHDLRRTFCTRALSMGISLQTVQYMMGHSDPKTTTRYDRGQAAAAEDAAKKLAF